jgi:hypothetical protein
LEAAFWFIINFVMRITLKTGSSHSAIRAVSGLLPFGEVRRGFLWN